MGLSRDDLVALLDAFGESEWTEMVLSVNGTRVELSNTGRAPEPSRGPATAATEPPRGPAFAAATPPPAAPAAPPGGVAPASPGTPPEAAAPPVAPGHGLYEVRAPSVGIFYRAPDPAAAPFVEVGQHVCVEDIVCIVEVMKLMNHVKAGVDGIVRSADAENGTMIEHGDLLFTIDVDQ